MDRKPTYEELERNIAQIEHDYRTLLENIESWVWKVDEHGVYTYASPHAESIMGYTISEIIGKTPFDFMSAEEAGRVRALFLDIASKGERIVSLEDTMIRKDGAKVIFETNATPLFDEAGKHVGYMGTCADITERKRSEEALRRSEETYRTLVTTAPYGIELTDLEGRIIYSNPAHHRIQGYEDGELIGKYIWDFMVDDAQTDSVKDYHSKIVREEPVPKTYTHRNKTRDGREIDIEVIWEYIRNADGEITGIISIIDDITGKKRAERELRDSETRLRQAQRLESIGNLAGGIAHDFNNLLFPIIGMSELLLEDLPEESPLRDNVHEILKAGKRGGELVKQILAFSRQTEKGKMPLRMQPLLKETLKLSRASLPSNIRLEYDVQNDCGLVVTDPTQLQQIVMNLITNAYHAVETIGGTITVQLKQVKLPAEEQASSQLAAGDYAVLTVADTGHGIDPHIIDKIFEPYFTTKEQGKGTGLGLAVVYGIVKEHGGDITVRSEPGNGAAFDVYLPILRETEDGENAKEMLNPEKGDERVLLIDDEVSVAKLERQMLKHLGYRVTECYGAEEGLKSFAANPHAYDLVITDMTMPEMTGDRLAEQLVQIRSDIPVIICTGFSEAMDERRAKEIGIRGFLMKPFSTQDLARLVRNVLDDRTA